MLETRDGKTTMITGETPQKIQRIVRHHVLRCADVPHDERPIILGRFLERSKFGSFCRPVDAFFHNRTLRLDVQPDGVGVRSQTETRRAHDHLVASSDHSCLTRSGQTRANGNLNVGVTFCNHRMNTPQQS